MSRRRLSPLARMVLHLAHELAESFAPERMVFASRHGEIVSTAAMLRDVAQQQPVSPAAFSHSVHNAIPGLWSIFQQQHGECSAIAAGRDSWVMALLEAQALLKANPASPVLVLLADEALPACFAPYFTDPASSMALGLVLSSGVANIRVSAVEALPCDAAEMGDWQRWYLSDERVGYQLGERHAWLWEKLA